jgi:hypothetical protein
LEQCARESSANDEIGELAGLPVHIYHLKAAGKRQWPLMAQAIDRIDDGKATGVLAGQVLRHAR